MEPTKRVAYYYRVMDESVVNLIKKNYPWLIDYVITHKDKFGNHDLDFQTGSEIDIKSENNTAIPLDKLKKTRSWLSIYKGTGRIITIEKDEIPYKIVNTGNKDKNNKYMKVPIANLTEEILDNLLEEWDNDPKKERYYLSRDGKEKKEGYYQTLISRRYTLDCKKEDDLLIFDKEFKIGYISSAERDKNWLTPKLITSLKSDVYDTYKAKYKKIPQDIDSSYDKKFKKISTECDFVGINKNGDLALLELKRWEDSVKIYLSPLQVGTYYKLLQQYMNIYGKDLNNAVIDMLKQKEKLGLINPAWGEFPTKLSGNVKLAVVVGYNSDSKGRGCISRGIRDRFKVVREAVEKNIGHKINYYTCEETGKLIEDPYVPNK